MLRSIIHKKKRRMGKKGAIGIIIFFILLMTILVLGFIAVMVVSVIDIASDAITPIMSDLGVVGSTNLSEVSGYTFEKGNTIVQALPWIIAIGYVLALVFTLVFVLVVGYNPHPAFIGLYLALMILLIFMCIIMSNMYQDIYTGGDDLAIRLQAQTTMSYLILHSPFIMAIIAVIGGIIMFTRQASAEGGGGGFGV